MTREEVLTTALQLHSNNICLELPTSFGKTLDALTIVKERLKDKLVKSILIVVPKNVLKKEWDKEIEKWNMQELKPFIVYSTYISLPKQDLNRYDCIIYDEAHHITDRCIDAINAYTIGRNGRKTINILLSATIKKSHKYLLNRTFYNLQTIKVDIKDAIDNSVLPDPEVLLIPLRLDKTKPNQVYVKRKSCKREVTCEFKNRWAYLKDKTVRINIWCTEFEYYGLLESDYELATNHARETWRRQLAIQRLKWLSEIKTPLVKNILQILNKERTLTFCNSIDQSEKLGKYPIHSENKELLENLEKFNSGDINHITAVGILNEGANITNLRVGIFGFLTASNVPTFQKIGRILRHEKPVIIIPYYIDTREEEIVEKMKDNFNPEKIHIINYLNEIKSYLK